MKVAFTNSIFFKQKYGGISRYFCSLISELIGINIDIKVFSLIFKNNYLLNIPKKNRQGIFIPRYPITNFLENKFEKILKLKTFRIFSLLLLITVIINFNFKDKIDTSLYGKDISYKENEISIKILNQNCELNNINFSELQKRNYYFNYLNICQKDFNLTEFLKYYRS